MRKHCLTFAAILSIAIPGLASAQNQYPGVSDEAIDAAPTLGQVIAFNQELGFLITNANSLKGVKQGERLAVVQNGILVAIGYVEDVNQQTATISLPNKRAYPSPNRRPRVYSKSNPQNDRVIFFPPRSK
ncbi:MAG: hypothetical protein AAGH89_08680 [Verrucomicrobiota bacterium]